MFGNSLLESNLAHVRPNFWYLLDYVALTNTCILKEGYAALKIIMHYKFKIKSHRGGIIIFSRYLDENDRKLRFVTILNWIDVFCKASFVRAAETII